MKKIKHIYMQNLLTITAILLISFIILGLFFSMLSYRTVMSDKRDTIYSNAVEAEKMVSAYSVQWNINSLEVKMAISSLSRISGYHILVCDVTGLVVSCSDFKMSSDYMYMTVPGEVLSDIGNGNNFSGITTLGEIYHSPRYVVGVPIMNSNGGQNIGYIFVSGETSSMAGLWRDFARIFLFVAVVVFIIAFALSMVTSKQQTKPINEMAAAAHKFARGDFSAKVEDTGRCDEIAELTEAFNAMADSMERSEKLRREFVSNVSHELKTPMTTITGFADGIIDGTIPPEKQNDYLRIISSETKRLSRLVRNMLKMSQLQAADASVIAKGSFDITELVRLALLSLEQRISDRNLDVEALFPEEAIITRGDKDAITQVVYNLLDNASKFADEGSTLKVDIWKQESKAYVSVENKGPTISKEELPMIFDRFHKADKSRSMDKDGVGLGLYIVKSILDNHGEDIFVTSNDGITKFVFTLTLRKVEKAKQL